MIFYSLDFFRFHSFAESATELSKEPFIFTKQFKIKIEVEWCRDFEISLPPFIQRWFVHPSPSTEKPEYQIVFPALSH